MSRVLITALGVGRLVRVAEGVAETKQKREYEKATYVIEGKEYNTEFIADAMVRHFQIDRVFMIGTARSMWEQVYYSFTGDDRDGDYYLQLGDAIDRSRYDHYCFSQDHLKKIEEAFDSRLGKEGSRCFLIKYGLNNAELIENFYVLLQIAELLQPGDEVYLDITHSFRSLAIFQYMMTSFIENLEDRHLKVRIYYGMLDVAREMGGKAPVVDLTMINELNHWIKGIYELEQFGSGYLVADLIGQINPDLGRSIRDLSDRINIGYLKDIRHERGHALWQHLKKIPGPGSFATKTIDRFFRLFSKQQDESSFKLQMTRWCFEKKRYAAGYITLTEALLTKACEVLGYDYGNYEERTRARERMCSISKEFRELYEAVNEIRRMVAHFLGGSSDRYRAAIDKCFKYCDAAERLFKKIGVEFLLQP